MIERILYELGPWGWWVLGLVLLAAEVVMPGVFLVWIGIAAILTGALSLLLWSSGFWMWQTQLVIFALFSVAAVLVGRRLVVRSGNTTDEPLLNQRGARLVGRTAVLEEPISEGRGRIRLDDTTWPVEGPDLSPGSRVRVIASSGRQLTVEAI
ncbi:membrane protein implicated in regulation of membrane protease activity [Pararhizobium capsulatum DSM 1112]|uniref:Membrane protein implicated in regulation of membrane protease activity n=1 Tax=Pararhizobium capsulatum DSM 1112 TaxID=1121113 RepID=A0ABU0BYB3_9HYPH|nr:NfeD family protein [Pararhizobium capsulatum]MDQ0321832.1 membrane protein implicated in regulation of membrane protease activity [Pararhizobium capsulatum DSM 1112]